MSIRYVRAFTSLLLLLLTGCNLLVSPTDTGARHLSAGDYSKAITSLNGLASSNLKNRLLARAYRTRADTLLHEKQCAPALADLESAAKLEPRLKLNYQLADHCFRSINTAPPLVLAQFLFEGGDTRTRILAVLLADAFKTKAFTQANQFARTLVSRNVWQADTARWLAKESLQQKRYSDGRFWLLKLVTRETPTAYVLTRLAMTCAYLKDDILAHRYFAQAWTLKPGNPVILVPWRAVCERRGDAECIARIDAQRSPIDQSRQLRPLLKSRR